MWNLQIRVVLFNLIRHPENLCKTETDSSLSKAIFNDERLCSFHRGPPSSLSFDAQDGPEHRGIVGCSSSFACKEDRYAPLGNMKPSSRESTLALNTLVLKLPKKQSRPGQCNPFPVCFDHRKRSNCALKVHAFRKSTTIGVQAWTAEQYPKALGCLRDPATTIWLLLLNQGLGESVQLLLTDFTGCLSPSPKGKNGRTQRQRKGH